MKKLLSISLLASLLLVVSPVAAATSAKTSANSKKITKTTVVKKTITQGAKPAKGTKKLAVTSAKGQIEPPPGYMELINKAHETYLAASKKAKAAKDKAALAEAEKEYSDAMEEALRMLGN
jgi:hypothetical protein